MGMLAASEHRKDLRCTGQEARLFQDFAEDVKEYLRLCPPYFKVMRRL
jgi:hypothetical protein